MKKAAKFFLLFCFSVIIISACSKSDTPVQISERIVTRVDVLCRQDKGRITRHYTDNKKMEAILLYLRLLHPKSPPTTLPELSEQDIYEITVHLSGGKKRVYRQTGHRYFSKDNRPWQMIDPQDAYRLYSLLRLMPDDLPVLQFLTKNHTAVLSANLFDKSTVSSGYSLCTNCGNFNIASTNACIFPYFLYNNIDKIV